MQPKPCLPSMKILIADHHAVFRHGLKDILTRHFPEAKFGEADGAQATLKLVRKKPWDLILLDATMCGGNGLQILRQIKQTQPKLPVLILSPHAENQPAVSVLQAGAAGYFPKINLAEELLDAVEKVLAGGTYIPMAIMGSLVHHLRPGGQRPAPRKLSKREQEILRLLASGKPAKAIARDLCLSPQTIGTHRTRMLRKFELHSTAELIRYAIQNRLVD